MAQFFGLVLLLFVCQGKPYPQTGASGVDTDGMCCFWASKGECEKNYRWMHDQCPVSCSAKSCLPAVEEGSNLISKSQSSIDEADVEVKIFVSKPDIPTLPPDDLVDRHRLCCAWASSGECASNYLWMGPNCKRSCLDPVCLKGENSLGIVSRVITTTNAAPTTTTRPTPPPTTPAPSVVQDEHMFCCEWASLGECKNNARYMNQSCPVACNPNNGCLVFEDSEGEAGNQISIKSKNSGAKLRTPFEQNVVVGSKSNVKAKSASEDFEYSVAVVKPVKSSPITGYEVLKPAADLPEPLRITDQLASSTNQNQPVTNRQTAKYSSNVYTSQELFSPVQQNPSLWSGPAANYWQYKTQTSPLYSSGENLIAQSVAYPRPSPHPSSAYVTLAPVQADPRNYQPRNSVNNPITHQLQYATAKPTPFFQKHYAPQQYSNFAALQPVAAPQSTAQPITAFPSLLQLQQNAETRHRPQHTAANRQQQVSRVITPLGRHKGQQQGTIQRRSISISENAISEHKQKQQQTSSSISSDRLYPNGHVAKLSAPVRTDWSVYNDWWSNFHKNNLQVQADSLSNQQPTISKPVAEDQIIKEVMKETINHVLGRHSEKYQAPKGMLPWQWQSMVIAETLDTKVRGQRSYPEPNRQFEFIQPPVTTPPPPPQVSIPAGIFSRSGQIPEVNFSVNKPVQTAQYGRSREIVQRTDLADPVPNLSEEFSGVDNRQRTQTPIQSRRWQRKRLYETHDNPTLPKISMEPKRNVAVDRDFIQRTASVESVSDNAQLGTAADSLESRMDENTGSISSDRFRKLSGKKHLCCFWTLNGQCQSNPYWMKDNCAEECAGTVVCRTRAH